MQISLREHNRREKRTKIKEAARQVFREKGYEAATTREIAARAMVANGTLFRYAPDKRELLLMVFNDDLDEVSRQAVATIEANLALPMVEQIIAFYRPRYVYLGRFPDISRYFVRDTFFLLAGSNPAGPEALRNRSRRDLLIAELARLIHLNQRARKIDPDARPEAVALLIHSLYLSESRQWVEAPQPDIAHGLARLADLVALAERGFGAARGPGATPET